MSDASGSLPWPSEADDPDEAYALWEAWVDAGADPERVEGP